MSPVKVPKIKLNDGREMPMIVFGTYARKIIPGVCYKAVCDAIKMGYRHIDTAALYMNEEEVGQAIVDSIAKGVVTRDELFITTKLWNDRHAKSEVLPALRESLQKLKLDYVDLYLMHWPVSIKDNIDQKIPYTETWEALEEVARMGLTKSIGVSNFNVEQMSDIVSKAKNIKPAVNQIEVSLNLAQPALVEHCQKLGVCCVAYTPLGLLSDARPEFKHEDYLNSSPVLASMAEKYGKTKAQIALRYLVDRNIAIAPKSFTPSRMEENLNIFDFKLSVEDVKALAALDKNFRLVDKHRGFTNYPF